MSTSAEARVRSALQLLREEPELVGVVLHLVGNGVLHSGSRSGALSISLFCEFSGLSEGEALWALFGVKYSPDVVEEFPEVSLLQISSDRVCFWISQLRTDRTDFAPAVPRALPPAPQSNPARF